MKLPSQPLSTEHAPERAEELDVDQVDPTTEEEIEHIQHKEREEQEEKKLSWQ